LTISQIRLRVSGSFQENAGVIPTYSVTFSSFNNGNLLATGSFTIGAVNCTASGATNGAGQALGSCSNTSAWVNVAGSPDSIPQFKVTVTGGAGSTPLPFNASASVAYEVNTVPEPATYGMMAAGLLTLAFARRKQ
jgi:PEP-CTERM motif